MYRALTIICVIALLSLGTTIVATIVQHSDLAKESKQISALSQQETSSKHELSVITSELSQNSPRPHPSPTPHHKKHTAASPSPSAS